MKVLQTENDFLFAARRKEKLKPFAMVGWKKNAQPAETEQVFGCFDNEQMRVPLNLKEYGVHKGGGYVCISSDADDVKLNQKNEYQAHAFYDLLEGRHYFLNGSTFHQENELLLMHV